MTLKLIYEPTVRIMTVQHYDKEVLEDFLSDYGTSMEKLGLLDGAVPDTIPEIAGRLCYLSFKNPRPGGNAAYIKHIKEVGHGSVLEHTIFGVLFEGISRSLSHELVRHRAGWGYSMLSQRYVDESDVAFVVPPLLRGEIEAALRAEADGAPESRTRTDEEHAGSRWLFGREVDLAEYRQTAEYMTQKLTDAESQYLMGTMTPERKTELRKAARSTARNCLPNCAETKVFCTVNARAVRWFIEERGSKHAEDEIRRLAFAFWGVLAKEAPNLFGDYHWECRWDGFPLDVSTPCRKV
jgi:thymidylate synthase (FAD)